MLLYYIVVLIMPDMDGTSFVPCLPQVFSSRGNKWHDQFIKITFMRYGHSAVGIIWVTLKSKALKTRDVNHHICCKIESDIRNMEEDTEANIIQVSHKDDAKARIEVDAKDRAGVPQKLDTDLYPLDPKEYPTWMNIVNIISGTVAPSLVNVENIVYIGEGMLEYFKDAWPEGCYNAITKKGMFFLMSLHQFKHPCSETMVYIFVKSQNLLSRDCSRL